MFKGALFFEITLLFLIGPIGQLYSQKPDSKDKLVKTIQSFQMESYSSGMRNLPIAIGIAVMSFKGLVALPVAVGAASQMLTAAFFYRLFTKTCLEVK